MLIKAGWWAVLFACLLIPGTYFLFVCLYIFFCLFVCFFDRNYDCCVCIYGGDVFFVAIVVRVKNLFILICCVIYIDMSHGKF